MSAKDVVFNSRDIAAMLASLAGDIDKKYVQTSICLVGIRTGGAHLAQRLARQLSALRGQPVLCGALDINLYRDDWSMRHHKPVLKGTEISFDLQDKHIILMDDVLYTGRTIRAALEALLDLGRPRRIELAVLVDRGGRELPIAPDYVGASLLVEPPARVDVLLSEEGYEDMVCVQNGTV